MKHGSIVIFFVLTASLAAILALGLVGREKALQVQHVRCGEYAVADYRYPDETGYYVLLSRNGEQLDRVAFGRSIGKVTFADSKECSVAYVPTENGDVTLSAKRENSGNVQRKVQRTN